MSRVSKSDNSSSKVKLIPLADRFAEARTLINKTFMIWEWAPTVGIKIGESDQQTLCPFHDDSTPSFSVKYENNIWKCFGCSSGGSFLEFYVKYQEKYQDRKLSLARAIEELLASHEELRATLGYSSIYRSTDEEVFKHDETGLFLWEPPKKLDATIDTVGMKKVIKKLRHTDTDTICRFIADCQEGMSYKSLINIYFHDGHPVSLDSKIILPQDVYDDFMSALQDDE